MKYKEWLSEWLSVCVKPMAKERTYEKYERICRKHFSALDGYEIGGLTAPVSKVCRYKNVPSCAEYSERYHLHLEKFYQKGGRLWSYRAGIHGRCFTAS